MQGCKRRVRVFIDIEGFEYELLQYLLDTHAEATCAILASPQSNGTAA